MSRLSVIVFVPLVLVVLPESVHSQPSFPSGGWTAEVREHIRTRIEAERRELGGRAAASEGIRAASVIMQFYEQRGFDPAWIGPNGPSAAVDSLLVVLRRADREGLRPGDYHVEAIAALRQEFRGSQTSEGRGLADLELLCSDAFLSYASHLLTGRASPTTITPTWNVPQRQADLLQLLTKVAEGGDVASAVASVRPRHSEYDALRDALRRYRALAAEGGWPTVPDGPTLERGAAGERVSRLRDRLAVTGDLSTDETPDTTTPSGFDASLHEAVIAFQERHGLAPDGVVGPATRAALNVPAEQRVQQLRVNLERWRWLPQDLGARYVLVNIAAATLRVVENGEEVLGMRAVTGQFYRQTPVFSGEISYLVFNPFWHVPHSIATRDKLPEIQKDPRYLERQRLKVFQGWGADAQPIDPSTIDWSSLSRSRFPYRLRQDPGPLNALGRVKFMFPNPHNVYLHDTPTRGLFARAERTFSSGCVRVERPIELAEYLLADHSQWSPQRIQSVLKNPSAEQSVPLRTRVPVHLQYWTAWADNGTVHFRPDAYERDGAVREGLSAAPSVE